MSHLRPVARLELGLVGANFVVIGSRLYAYSTRGNPGRIAIVDLADPRMPRLEHTLELRRSIDWLGVSGNKLAICENSRALHVLDATTYATWSIYPLLEREVWWGEITGDRLILALRNSGLLELDLAPRGTPGLRTILEIDGHVGHALRLNETILVAAERGGLAVVEDDGRELRERTRLFRHPKPAPEPEPISACRLQRAGDTMFLFGWSDAVRTSSCGELERTEFAGTIEDVSSPTLTTERGELVILDREKVTLWHAGKTTPVFARRVDARGAYVEVPLRWDEDQERVVPDRARIETEPGADPASALGGEHDVGDSDDHERLASLQEAEAITFAQRISHRLATIEDSHLVIYDLPEGSVFRRATTAPGRRR